MDNLTTPKTYRSTVDIQIGDKTTNAATTTLQDTGVGVFFDSGKTLRNRLSQLTSWNYKLGTKIGSGNKATGGSGCIIACNTTSTIAWGGLFQLYGCDMRFAGIITISPGNAAQGLSSELINCLFSSTANGVALFNLANSSLPLSNMYNCDFTATAGTGRILNNFGILAAERVTVGQASVPQFIGIGTTRWTGKDIAVFGTPTVSDYRWLSSAAAGARLYRPVWSSAGPKFTTASNNVPAINGTDDQTIELWVGNIKVVDRNGASISGIPVKLTDAVGEVQINTTTDSSGQVTYNVADAAPGAATTLANFCKVMDHYSVGTTYTQRHRSPFTMKVNTSDLTGHNSNYLSRTYSFRWPGYESVTTSSGSFSDLGDIIALEDPSGSPTAWTEASL